MIIFRILLGIGDIPKWIIRNAVKAFEALIAGTFLVMCFATVAYFAEKHIQTYSPEAYENIKKVGNEFSAMTSNAADKFMRSGTKAKNILMRRVEKSDGKLQVHFLDVGQGDATLIEQNGHFMLIDAGENDQGTKIQNYLNKNDVKTLDYLILTHPDSDHIGGADVIITKFDIGTVMMPDYSKDTKTYRDVIKSMEYKGYKAVYPIPGEKYELGQSTFTILAPGKEDYGDEANNYSISLLLNFGGNSFLFTGDAEEEAEKDMLDRGLPLDADVYQVGHHGSKSSSSEEFLKAASPEYAVISCGENNDYGHPHAKTLNSLRSMGIKTFRTDEEGTVIAVSDGINITFNVPPSETWAPGN